MFNPVQSLKTAFNKVGYHFERLSLIPYSKGVESELKSKGWQIDYYYPPVSSLYNSLSPAMLIVKDKDGRSINDNAEKHKSFEKDLQTAAANYWLKDAPALH